MAGLGSKIEWINAKGVDASIIGQAMSYRSGSSVSDTITCVSVSEVQTGGSDGNTTEVRTPLNVELKRIRVSRSDISFDSEIDDITTIKVGNGVSVRGVLKDPFEYTTHLELSKNGHELSEVFKRTLHEYKKEKDTFYDMSSYRSDPTKQITYYFDFIAGGKYTKTYSMPVQDNWTGDRNFVKSYAYHVK